MKELASNLHLSVSLESEPNGEYVLIRLEDPLAMTEIECRYEINQTTLPNRFYHVREALVIAMRRLIAQAVKEGMIKITLSPSSPGALMKLNSYASAKKPTGVEE